MKTTEPNQEPVVYYPTQKQLDAALQRALGEVGMTHQQLEAQAIAGKFDSELARRTWFCLPRV